MSETTRKIAVLATAFALGAGAAGFVAACGDDNDDASDSVSSAVDQASSTAEDAASTVEDAAKDAASTVEDATDGN